MVLNIVGSLNGSVSIAIDYEVDGCDLDPGKGRIFFFTTTSRLALEPTQYPVHWLEGGGGNIPGGSAAES